MNQALIQRKLQNAQKRIWIDEEAHPFPTVNCWCEASMDLDYSQGFQLMTSRLNAFLNAHADCMPIEQEQSA